MDAFGKIDRDALLDAGWDFICFGTNKTKCAERGYDFYDLMWAYYCIHADHTPHWGEWDGGHWGHMVDITEKLDISVMGDAKPKVLEMHLKRFVPNVTKDEFIAFIKQMETDKVRYFGWLSNNFAFFPSADMNMPWARAFA
jgi:hypothetical protein